MQVIALRLGVGAAQQAALRAITGADELDIAGRGLRSAARLLARLLVAGPGRVSAEHIDAVAVCDFDRLIAALYRAQFGDIVECHANCTSCSEAYEFSFPLARLEEAAAEVAPLAQGPDRDGHFTLDGVRFRPPTLADVTAVDPRQGEAGQVILRRCLLDPAGDLDPARIEAAMESVGPTLSRSLDAHCPHCEAAQSVHFDLVDFTLAMFARERPFVLRELHLLARAYGWSAAEILALPREDRRALVRFIESERLARPRAVA